MSDQYVPEECWACCGYGLAYGPLTSTGRKQWRCPWCRGTGVLHEGVHENGEACECHLGHDFVPGDHYASNVSRFLPGPIWRRYCAVTGTDPAGTDPAGQ